MRNFWANAKLACKTGVPDTTNEDIWASSAVMPQQLGFHPSLLVASGSLGPRQAMLDPAIQPVAATQLPRTLGPGPPGAGVDTPQCRACCGSALAGFIGGYSRTGQ